jgi:hypothetical protein
LFDAVTKLRLPDDPRDALQRHGTGLQRLKPFARPRAPKRAPSFQAALNRLTYVGLTQLRWVQFPLQCPVSTVHRIQSWTEPDKCPRCGLYLEKNALPYRIWD